MTKHKKFSDNAVSIECVTFLVDGGLKITFSQASIKNKSIHKFSFTLSNLLDEAIGDIIRQGGTRKSAQETLASYLRMHAANIEMRNEY
jgi:4-hydroxy-3-methylbut-2-en-1-yl diphosphate synthase IspG/GcpE